MPDVRTTPKIYHITHVENLRSIVEAGGLLSDRAVLEVTDLTAGIGMSKIKQRRLELPLSCHSGDCVGDFVPFYFCPRSIMLFVIHRANHEELSYRGGQTPIVHLEADLMEVVEWAKGKACKWAFSLSNAGAYYSEFRNSVDELKDLNWAAIQATDFREAAIKEGKQAEFLVHAKFPFRLIRRIGVFSVEQKAHVEAVVGSLSRAPVVELQPNWYY